MTSDPQLSAALLDWFAQAARALPWRQAPAGRRDPYQVLVSEMMLQQTQVSRVEERFVQFLARFPTIEALANAPEPEVLALWAGLGYYRRARLLHAAARSVVEHHQGRVPRDLAGLLQLPGVGRYTAGAIASIAFDQPEPLVDGNVSRVLLRLEGVDMASDDPSAQKLVWARAAQLVEAAPRPGAFNESLMELGATVCTPANPACAACPWAHACVATRAGSQSRIPLPKARPARTTLWFDCVVLSDQRGRTLLEQRPDRGLWAGLWQPPSLEASRRRPDPESLLETLSLPATPLRLVRTVRRTLTHREVSFRVWTGAWPGRARPARGQWFDSDALPAMSSAHATVLQAARAKAGAWGPAETLTRAARRRSG